MKSKQAPFSRQTNRMLVVLGLCVCFATTGTSAKEISPKTHFNAGIFDDDKKPARKSKPVKRSSAVEVSVKLIPDIFKKSFHLVTRSDSDKEMNFYVFDVEGNLVMNYKTKAGDKKTISGLEKGNYVYRVFCDDAEVASGKLQFR